MKDIKDIADGILILADPEADSRTIFDLAHVPPVLISTSSQLNLKIISGLLTAPSNITASYGYVGRLILLLNPNMKSFQSL